MSHFTKVKTRLTERQTLKQAMESTLRWPVQENAVVRGFSGNTVTAQLVAVNPLTHYDVGFIRNPGQDCFELVADFYGLRHLDPNELVRQINQNYALSILQQEAAAAGYQMEDTVYEDDGSIRVVLNQW